MISHHPHSNKRHYFISYAGNVDFFPCRRGPVLKWLDEGNEAAKSGREAPEM